MKKLLAVLTCLPIFCWGQTFPVQNLVVNGTSSFAQGASFSSTSSFAGQSTFTLSPLAPTPSPGDNSTKLATTAFVTSVVSATTPFVQTNAGLKAVSTVTAAQIWRYGFNSLGDVPPILYTASLSACSLNSGAGDNGSQVLSANGLCWIASFPPGPLDVREWGVVADGATDNTNALQAAWTYGGTVNTDILLPPSNYTSFVKFSSLTAPAGTVGSGAGAQGPLSAIRGQGIGQTVIESTVTGTSCALTFNAPSAAYTDAGMNRALSGFQLLSTASAGYGVCLNQITGMTLSNFAVNGFNIGLKALDAIRIRLENPQFSVNTQGIVANSSGDSYPNQWVIINPLVIDNIGSSFLFFHGTDIDIYGGDFENNNQANTAGDATIQMQGNPINGQKGLSVYGGYYEINGGDADFLFVQLAGDGSGSHSISGVEDGRISNTIFTTNSIRLVNNLGGSGQTNIDIKGSAFWSQAPYVPNTGRPYIGVAAPGTVNYHITGYDSNYFLRNVESAFLCPINTNCMNLPDGHIEQWGSGTTSGATPGVLTATWPLACPTAVDTATVTESTAATPVATSVGTTTTTNGNFYTATPTQGVIWRILCH